MQTGSVSFQAEVGKNRFLNELIHLVSPNCNGIHTHELIKNKIIELLRMWSLQFPKEITIIEALDALKRQGVIKVIFQYISIMKFCIMLLFILWQDLIFENTRQSKSSVSKNETSKMSILNGEKSLLLQKLLKSKKPEDLKAANQLIQSMVQEVCHTLPLIFSKS